MYKIDEAKLTLDWKERIGLTRASSRIFLSVEVSYRKDSL